MRAGRAAPALVVILLLPVAWVLGSKVDDTYEEPLTPERQSRIPVPIELSYSDYPLAAGSHTARTLLYLDDLDTLLRRDAIELRVATFATEPALEAARIAVPGTDCRFSTAPGASYDNNSVLVFERGAGCSTGVQASPAEPLMLTVRFDGPGRVGVWTYRHEGGPPDPRTVYVRDPAWSEIGLMVELRGRWIERRGKSNYSRADLLAIMWEIAPGSGWIWGVVGIATLVLPSGLMLLWGPSVPRATLARDALVRGAGAFLATAALASLYAVLTPPFQTPDEPHHFVDFANVTGRPHLTEQADGWSERLHVERLRFRPDERFRPTDIDQPGRRWPPQNAPDASVRGSGVQALWRLLAPWTMDLSAPGTLLALRLANGAVLALSVAAFAGLLTCVSRLPSPYFLAFPLFLVPTLPFLGMHVSNHAPVIAAYVIVALGSSLLVLDPDRSDAAGLFMGAGWAFAIALSRSAAPLGVFVGVLAAARLIGAGSGRLWSAHIFWAGLVFPVALVQLSTEPTYLARMAANSAEILPAGRRVVEIVAHRPWLLVLAVPIGAGAEWLMSRTRAAVPAMVPAARRAARAGARLAFVAVAAMMVGSLFFEYPELRRIDPGNRPDSAAYAADAVPAGLTLLRLSNPDYMTSVTFWGGFGWLETVPPDWFVSLLAASTGVALLVLLIHVGRARDARLAWLLAAACAGYALTLGTYAYTLGQLEVAIDLVGRYTFGLYLALVVLCWGALAHAPARPWIRLALTAACAGVHGYCLRLIVARYF